MAPLISLIITNYNDDRNYLEAAIASVLQQTYPNFELLIWDDGSTMGTSVTIARDYARRDRRVRVIAAEHRGRVAALTEAIAQTTGKYLGWVDHDDLLHPLALAQTVQMLETHPTTGMVYTDYLNIDEQGQVLGYGEACQIPYSPDRLLVDFMTFHFRLIRRSVFEQAGGLDARTEFAEDYDLCLRLSEITEIRQLKQPLYYYRLHGSNTSVRYRIEQVLRSRLAVRRALERRGLSEHLTIDVELPSGRFILRQRASAPASVAPTRSDRPQGSSGSVQPEVGLVVPLFSGRAIEPPVPIPLPLTWQRHANPRSPLADWKVGALLIALPLLGWLGTTIAYAQPVPSSDGTGTIVTPNGNQFNINGGTQSGNNLFHSFEQFGLNQGQIANFLANSQIQNILARVTGSNPSVINGLIQVTGSNANLFLLNPAGIVFGNNASLNVPGSFTATTASSIGIGNSWFNATGTNDYANLTGTPNSFAFPMSQPGAIVNAGNLAVPAGQRLTLIGGTVVNTGTLSAPGGEVTVTAVPGQNLVRVNQSGNVLSLEFQPLAAATAVTPLALPELLTGGNLASATGLTVNPNGTVQLTSSGTVIPATPGTAIVAGSVDVSSPAIGGRVNVVGNQVGLVGATINASGATGGGTVRIGGDYQGQGTLPNATQTVVTPDATIHADAMQTGDGGRVIIWSDQSTQFFGNISARGGATAGNGGFVEVSGKENLLYRGNVDTTAPNGTAGTLLLDPSTLTIIDGGAGTFDPTFTGSIFSADPDNGANTISWQAINAALGTTSSITLEATGNITINSITGATPGVTTPGVASLNLALGGLTITSTGGAVTFQTLTDTIQTNGGFIDISGTSLALGNLTTSVTSGAGTATAGAITLTSTAGSTTAGILDSRANALATFGPVTATGGNVTVNSAGDITLNRILTDAIATGFGYGATARAGDVTLTTTGAGTVRVTDTFTSVAGRTASISAIGQATGGGTTTVLDNQITITHGGGSTIDPTNQNFTVGDASVNGTAGVIDRGATFIPVGSSFAVAPNGDSVTPVAGITINSVNTPPAPPTVTSPLTGAEQDQPFTFSFSDLALSAVDVDNDNRTFIIASVAVGVTLTVNGNPVVPGSTTISPGDTLTFQGPAGAVGLQDAFTVIASDRVSNSSPTPVQIQVQPPDIPPDIPPDNDDNPEQPNPCALISCQTRIDPPRIPSTLPDTVLEPPSPEGNFTNAFVAYLGVPQPQLTTIDQQREIALEIERATGIRPAFVYVSFIPEFLGASGTLGQVKEAPGSTTLARGTDQLEVLVVTARGPAIRRRIATATRSQVMALAQQFREQVADPRQTRSTDYRESGYQLYQWLIAPVADELQTRGIGNLVFMMDEGLRSLPVAALYNGKRFLIEDYSVGLMPSLSLTNTLYTDIRDTGVLSLGISESTQDQPPLPAVPIELSELRERWTGQSYLNTSATLQTLRLARQQRPFGVIHLATHADFQPGSIGNSYVQLWNEKLYLNQVRELGWNNPQIELLVLSACATALGDRDAELGFAGLAVQTGVKSALASLWYVSDVGTTALMGRFYQDLRQAPIKAEALRQAQLAMLRGKVFVDENGLLQGIDPTKGVALPEELAGFRGDLVHPYFWSAFTIIGNPW
ncbi:CHAT domain-containing protein [Pantanalinema rosaneae CENA516]|uniref:CHAT domain-containing protein n=1 Tax=Pantanalinema rosaneae TaxID=1620701 RepID=UPI003D6FAA4A